MRPPASQVPSVPAVPPILAPPVVDQSPHHHGTKRRADDDLNNDQPLAKRFDLLNLGIHLHQSCPFHAHSPLPQDASRKQYIPLASTTPQSPPNPSQRPHHRRSDSSHMQVDDTKSRVYIHDLDAELADESDDEHPIFIPDIEKHLLKLPKAALINDADRQRRLSMQMVLYRVPQPLTSPEESDGVRRAVHEARERIRSSLPLTVPDAPVPDADAPMQDEDSIDDDPDAMDIG